MGQVLVVDDNEMNRDMLSRRLIRLGYEVATAEDGKQALTLVTEQPFDLVLLDIMMPKMNGYEVLEQMKTDDRLRNVPVIMISAVDDLDSVVKCIELGAEDYLFKPFNPVLLKARLEATLEKKRLYDQFARGLSEETLKPALLSIKQCADTLASGVNGQQAELVKQIQTDTSHLLTLLGESN
jgi:CheY-like chemotaxis protein